MWSFLTESLKTDPQNIGQVENRFTAQPLWHQSIVAQLFSTLLNSELGMHKLKSENERAIMQTLHTKYKNITANEKYTHTKNMMQKFNIKASHA